MPKQYLQRASAHNQRSRIRAAGLGYRFFRQLHLLPPGFLLPGAADWCSAVVCSASKPRCTALLCVNAAFCTHFFTLLETLAFCRVPHRSREYGLVY